MTSRRQFISLIGGAAAAWPVAAHAQQGERMRRVGMLSMGHEGNLLDQSSHEIFRQRLEELGWREGSNIRFDYRWAAGDADRLRTYAVELVSLKPDAMVTGGTPLVAALKQASTTVPIVFLNAQDPVGSNFVASLARPGGNITGFVSFEPTMGGKWVEILKEISPRISRIALLHNPQTHTGQYFRSIYSAGRALSLNVIPAIFRDAADIARTIEDFGREPNGGLLVLPDTSTNLHGELIVRLAADHRLPAIYPFRWFIARGGLTYYGTSSTDQWRKVASYIDRILKGEKPADLPVELPTSYELVINLKTAKALGLTVPPMLLARADEVIE